MRSDAATSSAADTDFTAKLIDVHPSNEDSSACYDMNLIDGIVHARYRSSFERPTFMTPDEERIRLAPTSNRFTKGYRVRIESRAAPSRGSTVTPTTGDPVRRHKGSVVAINAEYLDRAPSHVVLPLIPAAP